MPDATPQGESTPLAIPQPLPVETAEQTYQRLYGSPAVTTPPVTPTTPVVPTPNLSELNETLASLRAEIAALKPTPITPPTPVVNELEWVEKIRANDFAGAQRAMAAAVERELAPRLEAVRQEAYQNALNATQINTEMEKHMQSIRQANPDLVAFERYLTAPVTERMNTAQASGKVKTPSDFLREYRSAVDTEVASLRSLGLHFRAAGHDEALTRSREVISASPLVPQQVQSPTQTQSGPLDGPGETIENYFSRRRADESKRRGMG